MKWKETTQGLEAVVDIKWERTTSKEPILGVSIAKT